MNYYRSQFLKVPLIYNVNEISTYIFCPLRACGTQDGDSNTEENVSIDWDTEDELEIQSYGPSPYLGPSPCNSEFHEAFEIGEVKHDF